MSKLPLLMRYDLGAGVTAFSTTRQGGVSKGAYGEFNINSYCGDDADDVAANKVALASELGLPVDKMVIPHQTHGVEVRQIAEDFFALPANIRRMVVDGVDAVMTDVPGVCVGVSTADCIPILLYDPVRSVACAVHAGWRGTVARIAQKAVAAMAFHFRSVPADMKAVVGPGISIDAFEVGDEVYDEFASAGFDMSPISSRQEKWHIDLPLCNKLQLVETGVDEANITVSGICTYNRSDKFFSARRLGIQSGRIYTGIILRTR